MECNGPVRLMSHLGFQCVSSIYGGFLKWWVSPTGPWVFLLKMIILGCFWGYHHLRKHPYNPLRMTQLLSIPNEAQQAFLQSRACAFVANASRRILGNMCGSLFSWPWFVRFVKHSTGIQRFGQLLCQVRRFGTSWYNSKDNVGENSNLVWQPLSLEQVAYAIGLSTTFFYRPYINYAHFSSSRTVWHVNQNICVIKLV